MTDDEARTLRAALEENVALRDNLSSTQGRCTELLLENRSLKHKMATMKLRWLQLLEMSGWEEGPDDGTCVLTYEVKHGDYKDKRVIIERDVSPPPHRCIVKGHSYGHGDTCYYCGHKDET